ncbi:MAG: beta-glucosidase family protein [Promethearchaeota archaeon]
MSDKLPFLDQTLDLEARVTLLMERMTLDEKVALLRGKGFWGTPSIKRLGVKSFGLTDGPHGVAPHSNNWRKNTYFPTGITVGSTWNPDIAFKFGEALARETRANNKHVILGPGINIHRTPLCGRTFEYLTEDPFLNKEIAVAIVKGIQGQRISACIKHFVANNQETKRMSVDVKVSRRALEEIYLPAFKAAVMEGGAWSVMACYNKIGGLHGCENEMLLKETLMEKWGFEGFVVSDWFATNKTRGTASCLNAGLSLEMPGGPFGAKFFKKKKILSAIKSGEVTEETLNSNLRRLLRVMFLVGMFDEPDTVPKGARNIPEHWKIARQVAEQGMVLLKNENNLLPLGLDSIKSIAVIGPNANKKKGMWGGSSEVRCMHEVTPLEGIKKKCRNRVKIVSHPSDADFAVVVVGLGHKIGMDTEGFDRKKLSIPNKHVSLIKKTVEQNPNTFVVLVNGSPVSMEGWVEDVPVILEAWYGGMEGGHVVADILFGDVNPSGKLPVTFPKRLEDSPAHDPELNKDGRTYPGIRDSSDGQFRVYYDEDIYVGYRHFDTREIDPLFPFGHGLSYTTFQMEIDKQMPRSFSGDDVLTCRVNIKNTGLVAGSEVVQLYIQPVNPPVQRPLKELKGFKKVFLQPGEEKIVEFSVTKASLSYYSDDKDGFVASAGEYILNIGNSSRGIKIREKISYEG